MPDHAEMVEKITDQVNDLHKEVTEQAQPYDEQRQPCEGAPWRRAFEHAQTCAIGPTVAQCLMRLGVTVDKVATPHSTEGMSQALIELMERP